MLIAAPLPDSTDRIRPFLANVIPSSSLYGGIVACRKMCDGSSRKEAKLSTSLSNQTVDSAKSTIGSDTRILIPSFPQ